jgi:hypothetical protein
MDDDASPSHSGAASARGGGVARRPKKVERSCILCHRRKIRCDKKLPCSTCTRTGVLCCYPAEPPVRRPRKTTIADVAERLVRLERTLVAISSSSDSHTEAGTPSESTGQSKHEGGDGGENVSVTEEFLFQNGDSGRYINEILISRVLEEVSWSPIWRPGGLADLA